MKKIIKILCVVLLCFTLSKTIVGAKSYIKELFQFKENLTIEKELDGTAFLGGNKVNINNNINGIGFILGETLNIKGNLENIFGASTTLNMEGNILKDAFIISEEANIGGKVERDLYIFANNTYLNGSFNRNTYIAGTNIELNGTFNGNITINATNIKIGDNAKIIGNLKYNKDAIVTGLNDNIKTKTYTTESDKVTLTEYLYSFINSYINITILAIILIYAWESIFKKSLEQTKDKSVKNILSLMVKGFIILIGIPIIAIMALTTGVLTSVGVVGGIVYGIMVYISNIFTAYFIATELDKKFFRKNMNSYTLMIVGLLILRVLSIIPILGEFIDFVSLLLGLGILGNMIINSKS